MRLSEETCTTLSRAVGLLVKGVSTNQAELGKAPEIRNATYFHLIAKHMRSVLAGRQYGMSIQLVDPRAFEPQIVGILTGALCPPGQTDNGILTLPDLNSGARFLTFSLWQGRNGTCYMRTGLQLTTPERWNSRTTRR